MFIYYTVQFYKYKSMRIQMSSASDEENMKATPIFKLSLICKKLSSINTIYKLLTNN